MSEFDGSNGDRTGQREPPDPMMYAGMPPGGYEPHPLFPRDDDAPEDRDICYVTFRRKRSDGRVDNCPEDIPAGEIQSWADVTGPWGGGEYKVIGKDRRHRIVAWYPPKNGEWLLFDQESRPFTLRNGHRYSPAVAPPAPPAAAPPAPPPAPPTPPAPPGPSPTETLMLEVLRELRAQRQNPAPAPPAPPAPTSAASSDAVLIAMINAQGEMARAALTAALSQRPTEGSGTAVELLKVMREWAPQGQPQAQASMSERLGEYKQIRELTTPAAVMPPPSEFGEIKDIFMSVLQADAMNKTTAREEPPPSPPPVERRPPPRRPLCYLPGIGMVDEPDMHVILSDPAARARVLNALAVVTPAMPAAPGYVYAAPIALTPTPAPIAPAPLPTPVPITPAPTAAVVQPEPPPAAPVREMSIESIVADPALRERVLEALAATGVREASRVAEVAPGAPSVVQTQPVVAAVVSSAPAPSVAPSAATATPIATTPTAPTPTASKPDESATKPSAPAASDDKPVAEPVRTAERRTRVITDNDRMRAVPALRTIARLPKDQQRAELSKLPGMDREAVDSFLSVFLPQMDSFSHETWTAFASALPPEAVRMLVDGPGG